MYICMYVYVYIYIYSNDLSDVLKSECKLFAEDTSVFHGS